MVEVLAVIMGLYGSAWGIGRLVLCFFVYVFFFFQAEDGIRDLVRSRGLGDVYKRQGHPHITR